MLSIPKAKCSACINCTIPTWEKDKRAARCRSCEMLCTAKNNSIFKCLVIGLAFTLLGCFGFFLWGYEVLSWAEATGRTGSCTHLNQLYQCGFGFWDYVKLKTKNINAAKDLHEMEKLKRHFDSLVSLLLKIITGLFEKFYDDCSENPKADVAASFANLKWLDLHINVPTISAPSRPQLPVPVHFTHHHL